MSSALHSHRGFLVESLEGRVLLASLPAGFTESLVGGAISNATALAFAPDGRLFVTQQTGQLRVVDHGTLQPTAFTTVPTYASVTGERGLLGVAFDPDYFNNHYVYVYYTALTPAAHNRVSRFTADPNNQNVAVAGSETVLLDLNNLSGATNHNGGAIHFGADGKLYIAVGENANRANAQSFGNLLGKVLRMNKDGTIPTDNPYFNDAAVTGQNKLIWSLGLRNPFTFAIQPGTGRIFLDDVGESTWEEINDGIAHSNYGWGAGSPTIEGFIQAQTPPTDYRDPLFVYDHSGGQTAIIGGAFYNPNYASYPASYTGKYFFADLGAGWIHTLDVSGAPTVANFATGVSTPSGLTLSPDGSITYIQRGGTQGAYRIRATDTTGPTIGSASFVFDETKPAFGTSQRLRVPFSEYVGDSLTKTDLVLTNLTTGAVVPSANISVQYDASTNVATFSFPGLADASGALPNGNYRAQIANTSVNDIAVNPALNSLDFQFFVLNGDVNRDRRVDADDQAILTATLGQSNRTYSQGDLNYDGTVNAADQAILDANMGYWLPQPTGTAFLPTTAGDDTYAFRYEVGINLLDIYTNVTGTGTPLYRLYTGSGASTFISYSGGGGNDTAVVLGRAGIADSETFDLNGVQIEPGGSPLFISIGFTNIANRFYDGAGGLDTLWVRTGAQLTINTPQELQSLTIQDNGTLLNAAPGIATGLALSTRALSITNQSKLDLNDNDMILDYTGTSQLSAVEALIALARTGGTWLGTSGITSTNAKNDASHATTLAAIEGSDYLTTAATFDGITPDMTSALVKYTYFGDANLSGAVNFDDYVLIDIGFNTHRTGWFNGDFDSSGAVDFDDYVLIDIAFNTQGSPLSSVRPKSPPATGRTPRR